MTKDESPSQHVTVGLAEARPNNPHKRQSLSCTIPIHTEKEKNEKISPKSGVTIGQNITANSNEIFTEQNQNFQRQRQTQILGECKHCGASLG